jgi:hypothetical protein
VKFGVVHRDSRDSQINCSEQQIGVSGGTFAGALGLGLGHSEYAVAQ